MSRLYLLLSLGVFVLRLDCGRCFPFQRHIQLPHEPTRSVPARGKGQARTVGIIIVGINMATSDDELGLKSIKVGDKTFWTRQKELAEEMSDAAGRSLKEEQREKFARRRLALVGDTAYLGFIIFCTLWTLFENPFVAFSYSLGATLGLAYAYGLGKYVENLGGSVEDASSTQGAGLGEARFAFLILLFILVGKFRGAGLQEIPAISGFFTYQLASLRQGLKEFND